MIEAINAALLPDISQLGVVSKWYGVTRILADKQGRTYPSACSSILSDCDPQGRYAPAVPNSAELGIAYIELTGPVQMALTSQGILAYRYPARVVLWFNASRAGLPACTAIDGVLARLLRCLFMPRQVTLTVADIEHKVSVDIEPGQGVQVGLQQGEIFSRYSYQAEPGLHVWPYASFAINCTINVTAPTACMAYTVPVPTACECV